MDFVKIESYTDIVVVIYGYLKGGQLYITIKSERKEEEETWIY